MPSIQFHFFRPLMQISRWWQWHLARQGTKSLVLFRKQADWLADKLMKMPAGIMIEESHLGHVPGTWFKPLKSNSDPVILFLHGGSNVFSLGTPHRRILSYLAKFSELPIFGVDFRLAPENTYPAAHEDCFKAYCALAEQGKRIVLLGESSGGVLALSVMLKAKQAGIPLPILGAFISPLVDYEDPNLDQFQDAFVHPDFIRILTQIYLADNKPADYDWKPLSASFDNFPPIYIMVGEKEILRGEAGRLVDKAQQDGLEVKIELRPHVWHGWHVLAPQLPEATAALEVFGKYLAGKISQGR